METAGTAVLDLYTARMRALLSRNPHVVLVDSIRQQSNDVAVFRFLVPLVELNPGHIAFIHAVHQKAVFRALEVLDSETMADCGKIGNPIQTWKRLCCLYDCGISVDMYDQDVSRVLQAAWFGHKVHDRLFHYTWNEILYGNGVLVVAPAVKTAVNRHFATVRDESWGYCTSIA